MSEANAATPEPVWRYSLELDLDLWQWLNRAVEAEPTERADGVYRYNVELPIRLGDWLDQEAIRRSRVAREMGLPKISKRAIIIEALEKERIRSVKRVWESKRAVLIEALTNERTRSIKLERERKRARREVNAKARKKRLDTTAA